MNYKKFLSVLQIFLVITLMFSFYINVSIPQAEAAGSVGCCEETNDGRFCQSDVSRDQCARGADFAATSCDQTSFCGLGSCFDGESGNCFENYPKALCESFSEGKFDLSRTTNANICSVGCCVIGTQASLSTEARCVIETQKFPDLGVDFRKTIQNEQQCLDLANTAEQGCCVSEVGSCRYGAKVECSTSRTNSTGFFENKNCSQLGNLCNPVCAPSDPTLGGEGDSKSTTCLPNRDEVFWKDSCGNPEGVKENCDYSQGTLCGDSDSDGRYTCESLSCGNTLEELNKLSINLPGFAGNKKVVDSDIRNGESWCQYDYSLNKQSGDLGLSKTDFNAIKTRVQKDFKNSELSDFEQDLPKQLTDLKFASHESVGSRHYRSICINGKELIEPCKDFRGEWCLHGTIEGTNTERPVPGNAVAQSGFAPNVEYTEGRCLENRWDSCISECNTATPGMNNVDYKEAQEKDIGCCTDISKRDCAWVGGKCTPKVGPGFKFWEGEGTDICGQASLTCTFTVKCDGWNSITGTCDDLGAKSGGIGNSILEYVLIGYGNRGGWTPINADGDPIPLSQVEC